MGKTDCLNILISDFDGQYFKVDFLGQFNKQMLDAVRNVPGRRWNNDEKLWLIPNNKVASNELLRNIYATGLFNVEEMSVIHPPAQSAMSGEKYIDHQIRKINEALTARHYSEHTKISYKKWVEDFLTINKGKENIGEHEIKS